MDNIANNGLFIGKTLFLGISCFSLHIKQSSLFSLLILINDSQCEQIVSPHGKHLGKSSLPSHCLHNKIF